MKNFIRRMAGRLYSKTNVLLLKHTNNTNQQSPAFIRPASEENIKDTLSFQSEKQLKRFKTFLLQGEKGFLAYLDNKCVHRSWLIQGPGKVKINKFYRIQLPENSVFIEYCETAERARGKNIFAHVLSEIARQFGGKEVFISVEDTNKASLRSMQKAGFTVIKEYHITIILNLVFVKEIRVDNK